MTIHSSTIKTAVIVLLTSIFFWWFWSSKKVTQSRSADVLIVGTNAEYQPYSFIENDIIVGFDIDVIKNVAQRLNKKIELRDMTFDGLIPAAQLGQIEVIAAGISPTPEREKKLLFTKPYLTGDPLQIISTQKNPLKTVPELNGKNVVVNEGFHADYYMTEQKDVILTRLATVTEALMALQSGRADAFVTAKSPIQPFFNQNGTRDFVISEIPETMDEYALAISPEHKELLPQIQEALDAMQDDGTLQHIKQKWHLE